MSFRTQMKIATLQIKANELKEIGASMAIRCHVLQKQAAEETDETNKLMFLAMRQGIMLVIDEIDEKRHAYEAAAEELKREEDEDE